MSAVLESDGIPTLPAQEEPEPKKLEIREGDWRAYQYCLSRSRGNKTLATSAGGLLAYQRACALAYLGKRAQLHGGVCSTRHPHIITPQFIVELEASNRASRYMRYPWLRAMMQLLAEIEFIQDQISSTNVISLVPPAGK